MPQIIEVKKFIGLLVFLPFMAAAQVPGYYNSALGLNGQPLRTALHDIIKNHTSVGYSALWTAYQQTDVRPDDGKVWDIYSDKPGQTPPYEFTFITDQCGNYNSEADCYNREHSFPESYFGGVEPMRSDIFQVYPTDGWVNNKRANFPYGKVTNPTWTSQNGSKLGPNAYAGAPSGSAFEPIDSFKGDLARTYFYMATRYYTEDAGWSNWEMANGAELKPWAAEMLLEWHHNDPVSKKELDRNNAVYNIQQNRNPFIDYPQFADCIWGTGDCSTLNGVGTLTVNNKIIVYPNPVSSNVTIRWQEILPDEVLALNVWNPEGQVLYHEDIRHHEESTTIITDGWAKGIYLLQVKTRQGVALKKLVKQ